MRDFTKREQERLSRGECPLCGRANPTWRNGPLGGASRNLEMACCGAQINVVDPDRYGWPPPPLVGQVLDDGSSPSPSIRRS